MRPLILDPALRTTGLGLTSPSEKLGKSHHLGSGSTLAHYKDGLKLLEGFARVEVKDHVEIHTELLVSFLTLLSPGVFRS